jgi:hypothetical protein
MAALKKTVEVDVTAAINSANALTATARQQERPEKEETRFVSLRIKETDYCKLKGLFGKAGLSLSAGMKMSAFYLAEQVESGAFVLTPGGYVDKRGR